MRWSAVGVLSDRDLRRLLLGQTLSQLGSNLVPVALAFAVLEFASPAALGATLAGRAVSVVLLAPVAGVWADRVRRERILVLTNVASCVVQSIAAALLITHHAQVWHLVVLQLALGCATALMLPALGGVIVQSVAASGTQQANALLSLSRSATAIAGPALAGVLVVTVGAGWALGVDALTYALAAVLFMRLNPKPYERRGLGGGVLGELRAGWHDFVARRWLVLGVAWSSLFHVFVVAPLLVVAPVVAKESLGGAASWSAIATGMGAGAVLGGMLGLWLRPGRPMLVAFLLLLAMIPQIALLAAAAPVAAIVPVAVVGQMVFVYFSAVWGGTIQGRVPPGTVARINSYVMMIQFGLLPIGFVIAGVAASSLGADNVLWFAAAWLLVSTVAVLAAPDLRRLTRIEPDEPGPGEDEVATEDVLDPAVVPEPTPIVPAAADARDTRR